MEFLDKLISASSLFIFKSCKHAIDLKIIHNWKIFVLAFDINREFYKLKQ